MTLLTEAMSNPVGPYIPARPEWLEGWCGPVAYRHDNVGVHLAAFVNGGWPGTFALADLARTSLDLRRTEVRDLLVRRGAPEWARDIPAALWVWAVTGKAPTMLGRPHGSYRYAAIGEVLSAYRCAPAARGWEVFVRGTTYEGPETGDAGRDAADRAALAHGCILAEPGGYIVLTPKGPGWWPKEQA